MLDLKDCLDLQVVTTARSVSCARHLKELQRKVKSINRSRYEKVIYASLIIQ